MSTSSATPLSAQRSWIVAPWWDMIYVVLTPVLIVPAVALVLRSGITPEQVGLGALAFASLGHHFPGFLRAYGERDLWQRYRRRLTIAPLLFLLLALLFSPPPVVASALGIPWRQLHGLEVILLVWGTWHGLMQTYGFMRIYDLRRGEHQAIDAWLDRLLCVALFVGGVVMSESRMFGVANAMWQAGLPYFDRSGLQVVRWIVGIAMGLFALLCIARQVQRHSQGLPINWQKLLLVSVTGWFFWHCGSLSTNLLVGIAMFEIYHALQYDAIVWIYDRRLFARASERLGAWAWLFRDRWSMLGAYVALIAAYSCLRLMAGDVTSYLFVGQSGGNFEQALLAFYVTSSFLHFYLDGFIWKVSEPQTQASFVDRVEGSSRALPGPGAWRHVLKWSFLLAVVGGLLVSETWSLALDARQRERMRAEALARLTPDFPECQLLRSQEALDAGQWDVAAELAWQAVQQPGRSSDLLSDAGATLLQAQDFARAAQVLGDAAALRPDDADVVRNYGAALLGIDRRSEAMARLRRAIELNGASAQSHFLLGHALLHGGEPGKSIVPFREALRLEPDMGRAHLELGTAYYALHKWPQALQAFRRAAERLPDQPAVYVNLGSAELQQGQVIEAEASYRRGLKLAPDSPELNYNLGMLLLQTGRQEEGDTLLDRAEKAKELQNARQTPVP